MNTMSKVFAAGVSLGLLLFVGAAGPLRAATIIDVPSEEVVINGAIYRGAPTKTYFNASNANTFLRLDSDASKTSQGFNSSASSAASASPLLFADIPMPVIDDISYLEFALAIVEPGNGSAHLDDLRIAISSSPNPSVFDTSTDALTLVYAMNEPDGIDVSGGLGMGTNVDLLVYVPKQSFLAAGAKADTNVVLFSALSEVEGGPERWTLNPGSLAEWNQAPAATTHSPEPSTLVIWGVLGLGALGCEVRRRKRLAASCGSAS